MKRILLLLLLAPAIGQAQSSIDDLSYSWLRVGYILGELDVPGDNVDLGGLSVDGSVEVRDHLLLFASYDSQELDDFPNVTMQQRTVGIGVHFDLGNRLSLFGQLGYYDIGVNDNVVSADDDGARAIAGVRLMPWSGFEIRGGVDHLELDTSGGDTGVFVGGDLWLTDQFALTADVTSRDDSISALFGGRIYFGRTSF